MVEQAADVAHGSRRDAELAFERINLGAIDWTVGFGELGRQDHNANGEKLVATAEAGREPGRTERIAAKQAVDVDAGQGTAIGAMAQCRPEYGTERAT